MSVTVTIALDPADREKVERYLAAGGSHCLAVESETPRVTGTWTYDVPSGGNRNDITKVLGRLGISAVSDPESVRPGMAFVGSGKAAGTAKPASADSSAVPVVTGELAEPEPWCEPGEEAYVARRHLAAFDAMESKARLSGRLQVVNFAEWCERFRLCTKALVDESSRKDTEIETLKAQLRFTAPPDISAMDPLRDRDAEDQTEQGPAAPDPA